MMEYLCPWEAASYLGLYSSNVPSLLYYSHFPALIGALFLGIFIFFRTEKSPRTYALLGIAICFATWSIFDLFLWATNRPDVTMFLWSLQILLEVLVFIFAFLFVYSYQNKKGISPTVAAPIILSVLILAALIPTHFNLDGVNLIDCTAVENTVAKYLSYGIEIIAIIAITTFTMELRRKMPMPEKRKETTLVGVGTIIFLMMFSYGNLIGSFLDDWVVAQYGLFGMIVFMAFIAYMIVRFRTFNIKLLATQALVWALWIMIGAILLVAQTNTTRAVTGITEIIAIVFGIMLIRSVRREVEQRELLARLNGELADKNVKLTEVDRQKTELVSFANHDLQSPLNKVTQNASLILTGVYKEPGKVMETVGKIKFQAEEAIKMVINFLDLRKIEEGQMPFNPETKDMVKFVRDIVAEQQPAAANRKITLSFVENAAATSLNANIDPSQIRQVIDNLIGNSLKYTESSVEGGKQNWVKVSVAEEQKSVLIKIQDSGLGMDKTLLPVLFEQFRRDPSVAKKIQGTGLGLFITKQFVELHHGQVWAESEGKGLGSTFFVRLPKA